MEREKVNQWPGQFKDSLFCEAQCEEFGCWCLSPWVWWEWWAEIPAETWILLGLWGRAHPECPQEASLCPSRSCLKHISVSSWRPWESHNHLYLIYHNFCQILIIMIKVCLAPFIKAINKTLTRSSFPVFILIFIDQNFHNFEACLQYYNVIFLFPQKARFQNAFKYPAILMNTSRDPWNIFKQVVWV